MEDDLRNSLDRLHQELNSTKNIDESSRDALLKLKNDIEVLLEKKEREKEEEEGMMNSLKASAEKFEATHPELSESIHIVIHTLSNMGI